MRRHRKSPDDFLAIRADHKGPGRGMGSDPGGGTDGVRPGGRGDRRRSGGNADHAARRSPRGTHPKPTASTGGDRWSPGEHPEAGRPGDVRTRGSGRNTPTANAAGAGFCRGFEGGRQPPSPARRVIRRVSWLVHLSVAKPATRGTRENVPPGIARNSLDRAVAGKLPGLFAARLKHDEDVTPALPAERPGFALPVPLGNPRSTTWGDSTARRCPEMPPKRPSRPVAGSNQLPAAAYRCVT